MEKIRFGVSACLLGENVRYDGGHKLDPFLTEILGQFVEYIPVCPEVESGLPVPREAMRLQGNPDSPRLITVRTQKDMSHRMIRWATRHVVQLEKEDLCGFVFKSDSPSCGMKGVKVYNEEKRPRKKGAGLFARVFMDHFPLLPVEDEERLRDPGTRENFIERIFTLKRWREVLTRKKSLRNVADFHAKHHLLILSHSPTHEQAMERLAAGAKTLSRAELYRRYQTLLTESLRLKATPKKNADVLQHVVGYFKGRLSSDEQRELLEKIDHYRRETVPLIVPITLINHYVRKYDLSILKQQAYLNPHPLELRLRNHV